MDKPAISRLRYFISSGGHAHYDAIDALRDLAALLKSIEARPASIPAEYPEYHPEGTGQRIIDLEAENARLRAALGKKGL